ncbi:hypothetical protein SDRG_13121 [Saprolegnia diclina VS20]|uniref:non-specific serine/threonine protein kinase n=1 Tax=Saprolegnia diclina (strain VS20) TaxID=1156394 RepID=T0RAN2_SAPDV|nr:hypothetical protein SDRG_13121 [Saprolegnia diclina VS20]EQC29248.1 hypothetical protein SDRG_13121 [Saprolegnia diclina VS20]|eukprot:XP_008617426.1 hypothetical protein SDRG_13121 [Saprolegnia diclina VS20]
MRCLPALLLYAVVASVMGACPYSDLSLVSDDEVLVADASCPNKTSCTVGPTCKLRRWSAGDDKFANTDAIGDMSRYDYPNLVIFDSPRVTLLKMQLPATVTSLTFGTIVSVADVDKIQETQWSSVLGLEFQHSKLTHSNTINWPRSLHNISLVYSGFINIPQNFPPTLRALRIEGSNLTDLQYLPSSVTSLNVAWNQLSSITNYDWEAFTLLRFSNNSKLQSISRIQLSSKLEYFNIAGCTSLNNITVDASSFAALDALQPAAGDADVKKIFKGYVADVPVSTSATGCAAIGGEIKRLWQTTNTAIINVCVLSTASNSSSSSSKMGLIIGVAVGGVVLIGAIVAFVICKRRKAKHQPSPVYNRYEPSNTNGISLATAGRTLGTNGTKTIGTNGTGGPTAGTTGSRRPIINPDVDVILDVKPLLHHRLELRDLDVTSNKPLASGAFGEVWLGTYGGKQVAVKRMKNQDARMAQKFIEEIVLMSQMSSDYIVKLVVTS